MALTTAVASTPRPVTARHFAKLKLRITGNSFRGRPWRVALFAVGIVIGLCYAAAGFLLSALPGIAGSADAALLVAAGGGGVVALAWTLLPLVFFGVDETIDPSRFALLPLPRRTLVTGLLTAALIGVPAAATLIATAGLVLSAGALSGVAAALVEAVGVVLGLVFCVAVSRAVTSAFANLLRSRRTRDLAAVLLAVTAALIGPLQVVLNRATTDTDWRRFLPAAEIAGWTPFGAPYTAGFEVASGRWWAALLKIVISVVAIVVLMWWWSRTLESAMVGTVSAGPAAKQVRAGAPVAQLFPGVLWWARRGPLGAVLAREVRYWWRDARRRANLITFAVAALFVSAMVNFGSAIWGTEPASDVQASTVSFTLSMIFVGTLGAVTLANQFGYDGTAYAADVVAGVPGRVQIAGRAGAFSIYVLPLVVLIAVLVGLLVGEPGWIPLGLGTLIATFGCGLALNSLLSVVGAYALPETSNPFALNTGAGLARGLLSTVAILATVVLAAPMLIATLLAGDLWLWLALPIGLLYGLGAARLGSVVAGDVLDRRMPELLLTITPRR
ncbi:ABC-2 type transport system permease protein [Asanoa ferruginea]|uniref:ABC-2 type transport system permease protein n=1 Tax=Asanoa ferruginea TaxID=53367 RepID=A0A3D9ZFQ3_9ACTN|nr:ABC transporter permease [Asanoa ferruginea]REF96246.1 ABC-2 type transport system permease protein [Asanoa ferruginea]GIF46896.1 transporter [Asanoa ferruginea]